jgi:sortase A
MAAEGPMKKRIIITIALILLFLVGLSVLLYPIVSDYLNSLSQSRVIANFNEDLAKLSVTDYEHIFEAAREYNQRLVSKPIRFMLSEDELKEYFNVLDFTGRGVIGTLEIEAIKVKLPVYLGTSEGVLQAGLGHLEGSSLPVGGPGTHSVISGHRGLPSSTLLTNADKLREGDIFVLRILNEAMTYEIDRIVIVEPDNMNYLEIETDMDYCTLITCTPYGINSHRLLLRGHRIFPETTEEKAPSRIMQDDAKQVSAVAQYAIAAVPVLLIISIYMIIKHIKLKRKG